MRRRTLTALLLSLACTLLTAAPEISVSGSSTVTGLADSSDTQQVSADTILRGELYLTDTADIAVWGSFSSEHAPVLERLSLSWYPHPEFLIQAGRINTLSGYGFLWNPSDLISAKKQILDPNAGITGTDACMLTWDPGHMLYGSMYIRTDTVSEMPEEEDLSFGCRITALFEHAEFIGEAAFQLTGASSFGAGVFLDLAGAGWYAEIDSDLDLSAGISYLFPGGMQLVCEYFYHHGGLDEEARQAALIAPQAQWLPGYLSTRYLMLSLSWPFYDIPSEASAAAVFSPDSGALITTLRFSWDAAEDLTAVCTYTYSQDLLGSLDSETSYLADHTVTAALNIAF